MKIDKSYLLAGLGVLLLVSLFLNIRSCNRPPVVIHDDSQWKVDSLLVVNRIKDDLVDSLKAGAARDSLAVVSLGRERDRLDGEIKKKDEIIRRQRAVIAENDRKIAAIKDSKVDMSDEDLSDLIKTKLPKLL